MKIEITEPASEKEFEDYYELRWRILRKPWGQAKGSEKDEQDAVTTHIMAKADQQIIGCCRLQFNSGTEAQIRYMAVDDNWQGKGVGALMLKQSENTAYDKGAENMILEARENAVPFYKKYGYNILKESYLLFGEIQHYTMYKRLKDNEN